MSVTACIETKLMTGFLMTATCATAKDVTSVAPARRNSRNGGRTTNLEQVRVLTDQLCRKKAAVAAAKHDEALAVNNGGGGAQRDVQCIQNVVNILCACQQARGAR